MSNQEQKLLQKIKKLLTLGNDQAASEHEAQSALKKANMLLMKNNLSVKDISISSIKSEITETDKDDLIFGLKKEEGVWEKHLISTLCHYNLCQAIIHKPKRSNIGKVSIVGKDHNVDIVLYMYDVAHTTFRQLSKDKYNAHRKQVLDQYRDQYTERQLLKMKKMGYRMPWIRTYLKGCCIGLQKKLAAQKQQVMSETANDDNNSNKYEMVVVNTNDAIEQFLNEKYSNLKNSSTKMNVRDSHGALSKGIKDGKNAKLHRGVDKSNNNQVKSLSA